MLQLRGEIAFFENVPAQECQKCGEQWFSSKVIPESNEYHRKAMEYYSYTLVGLKKYHVAIQEIEQLREGVHRPLGFWPSLALAYSYLKIDNHDRYEQWIRHAKIQKGSSDSLALVKGIYPELEEQFASGESTKYE